MRLDPSDEGPATDRVLLVAMGRSIRAARRLLGITQRELSRRTGISQPHISAIERGRVSELTFTTAEILLRALGVVVTVRFDLPIVAGGLRQRDAVHARCVGYVRRRLERDGWEVRTEVEIAGGRSRGWIDVLAYHPVEHVLLIIEVKTEVADVGAIDRQLGWYEREAWAAARDFGWRPRAVTGALLVLATEENDSRIRANREVLAGGYELRAARLAEFVHAPMTLPRRGARGLAMIDPSSRRRDWLRPTVSDGRRSPPPYRDYADAAAKLDTASRRRAAGRRRTAA